MPNADWPMEGSAATGGANRANKCDSLRLLRVRVALAVATLVSPPALALADTQVSGGTGLHLRQEIRLGADGFWVCPALQNDSALPIFIPRRFKDEIRVEISPGKSGNPGSIFSKMTPMYIPPPNPWENTSYIVLDSGSSIGACLKFQYKDAYEGEVRVTSSFQSWLSKEYKLAPDVERFAFELKTIKPPLFSDETILAEPCYVDTERHSYRCD